MWTGSKLLSILIAVFLMLSLVTACSQDEEKDEGKQTESSENNAGSESETTTEKETTTENKATENNTNEEENDTDEETAASDGQNINTIDFASLIEDADNWKGPEDKLIIENGYATFRGGNAVGGYVGKQFENEVLEFKAKMTFESDWNYFALRVQQEPTKAIWESGVGTYVTVVKKEGIIALEKWVDTEQNVLLEVENMDFLDEEFHTVKFGAINQDNGVRLIAYIDNKKVIDYVDSESAITEPGYFSAMTYGSNTMAIGSINAGEYVKPEEIQQENLSCRDEVAVARQAVDLMGSEDSWYGWYVDVTKTDNNWTFNPSEEYSQFQGCYADKIFGNVEYNVNFKVDAIGEWVMFYLRHITKDVRSSAWGSSEFGPADNYSIVLYKDNKLQILKWKNGSPKPLIDIMMDSTQVDMRNTSKVHELTARVENIEKGGRKGVKITVIIDGYNLASVTDFENPYTNPGYFGVHGYNSAVITLVEAEAQPLN